MSNIGRAIVNKEDEVRFCLVTLLCEGHLLIEDVPGVGKTMLAKSLARSLDCTFRRIQFTPDLLPSAVTRVRAFNQKVSDFEFRPGPSFANTWPGWSAAPAATRKSPLAPAREAPSTSSTRARPWQRCGVGPS